MNKEARIHINQLNLRPARLALQLVSSRATMQLHIDNMTAIAYIRKMGETRSSALFKESLLLWCQAIQRKLMILPP